MSQRSLFWDNYKGILIFLVVYAHALYSYRHDGAQIVEFIYMFHMPAFVFTTGFLSKSENCFKGKAYLKLLTLHFVFNTAMLVFAWFFKGSDIKVFVPYYSYWYLISVILWRLMAKPISKIKGVFIASIMVALLIGFFPDADNTMSIARTVAFLPYFLLGYLFDFNSIRKALQKKVVARWGVRIITACFFIALYMFACKHSFTSKSLLYSAYSDNNEIFTRIMLMVIAFASIALLFISIPDKKIPLITTWGKNCLLIYLIHRPFTLILQRILPDAYSSSYLLIALVFTFLLLIVFGNNAINRGFADLTSHAVNGLCTRQPYKQAAVIFFIAILMFKAAIEVFTQ